MKGYVAGFLFSNSGNEVLLIRKNRPDWQAGLWNGIGGRVYSGELWPLAMDRLAKKEAGISVDWKQVACIVWEGTCVYFFSALSDTAIRNFRQMTDEEPMVFTADDLREVPLVPCLDFMIPLSRYHMTVEEINGPTALSIAGSGEHSRPRRKLFSWGST